MPFRLEGLAVRVAHLKRKDLTAFMIRSLSPTLDMLISFKVS